MALVGLRHFYLKLRNTRTLKPLNDDSGDFQVMTAGSPARATIYNASGTQLTQEVVGTSFVSRDMTDGTIEFYTQNSVSSVDISILTAGGRAFFLKGVTASQHRVDVDPEKENYILVLGFNDKASCTTVRPLGMQLRKGMLISDVTLKVTAAFAGAAAASNFYNVGRSTVPLGFVIKQTVSSVGYKPVVPTISGTGIVVIRKGTDLVNFHLSSTALVDYIYRKSYFAATGVASNNLVVKRFTAATLTHSFTNEGVSGAGKAYIYYFYTLLPTERADTSF